jgi:ABC-type Mn2+/Zn2+ transport system permease subunit
MFALLIDLQQHVVLRHALLAGASAGVAGNLIGAFVLVERITHIT